MRQDDVAIKVSHISKTFRVPHEQHNSLKDKAVHIFGPRSFTKFKALEDIDFEIKKGEFFGIVGKNGSGKSTLLKILANIYQPTSGEVTINGSLAPFIELGVGFNMELTGRENVFLSGTILGLKKKKIEEIYDDIVDFAELGEFMDQKLKNYSSGMQVRLAFSIAVRADSEILLIDEVLAVGDSNFQRKCFDIFEQYKATDKTVILVTHDMDNIRRFCDRAALLTESRLVSLGHPNNIASKYDQINQAQTDYNTEKNNKFVNEQAKVKAEILNSKGKIQTSFREGEMVSIKLKWQKTPDVKNIGMAIMKNSGEYVFGRNTLGMKDKSIEKANSYTIDIKLSLERGRYYLMYGTFGKSRYEIVDFVDKGPDLVINPGQDSDWEGLVHLESKWHK